MRFEGLKRSAYEVFAKRGEDCSGEWKDMIEDLRNQLYVTGKEKEKEEECSPPVSL